MTVLCQRVGMVEEEVSKSNMSKNSKDGAFSGGAFKSFSAPTRALTQKGARC